MLKMTMFFFPFYDTSNDNDSDCAVRDSSALLLRLPMRLYPRSAVI